MLYLGQNVPLRELFLFSHRWGPAEFSGRIPLISLRAGQNFRVFAGVSKGTRWALIQGSCRVDLQVLYTGSLLLEFILLFVGRADFFFHYYLFYFPTVQCYTFTSWHCTNTSSSTLSVTSKLSKHRHWDSTCSSSWHGFLSHQRALSFDCLPPCQKAPQAQWLQMDAAWNPVL